MRFSCVRIIGDPLEIATIGPILQRTFVSASSAGQPKRRIRVGRILLALYLVVLAASTVARLTRSAPTASPAFAEKTMLVSAISGEQTLTRQIKLAYLDYTPPDHPDAPVVVLLHGSPGSGSNFQRLAPLLSGVCPPPGTQSEGFGPERGPIGCVSAPLARPYRVIAPDLPGLGNSESNIPDYSFRAHAYYLRELLDKLNVRSAHIVGYSMGGGPALNLYDIAPERVKSITLLSSLAAQEFELTGDYYLNHIIHGLQLAFFWGVENLVPHFGALNGLPGVEFSLNFYQSDQRPLRDYMQRFEKPFLIIHGKQDGQVPPEAAFEHHRLVPQSDMIMTEEGHGMVFGQPHLLDGPLLTFFNNVEDGHATTRAQANPKRIAAAAEPVTLAKMIGIATFAFVVLLTATTIISEDLACVAAGVLIAQGRVELLPALIACFVGIFIGDVIIFRTGRRLRVDGLTRSWLRWLIPPLAVEQWQARTQQHAFKSTLMSRFMPGSRLPAYFAAGAGPMRIWRFVVYAFVAVAVWVPVFVTISALLGGGVANTVAPHNVSLGILAAFVVIYPVVRLVVRWSTRGSGQQ